MQHDAKKSLEWSIIYGTSLMLQLLYLFTPIIACCSQFWRQISKVVVCTCVRIQNVLIRQEDLIHLSLLLRLLCTIMYAHFLHLSFTGLVLLIFIFLITAFISNFLVLRHCCTTWAGLTGSFRPNADSSHHYTTHTCGVRKLCQECRKQFTWSFTIVCHV